jgi:UDP-2,3-diacylglucosamine pyrophosphatase LpxH
VKPRFIISDLHLGEGRQSILEDFDDQASENFVKFFEDVSRLGGVKVILNGDFIDFPQVILGTKTTPPNRFLGTTEAESTLRLQKVIAGHAAEFNALKDFLTVKGNELLLISGNHDIDFAWNRVLLTFMQRIRANSKNFKFGMAYKEAGVYVTHGHQYSDDNQIDVPINFTFNRLNSCWGSHFVEHFFNQIEDQFPLLDNARPMWKVAFSAILSEKSLVTGRIVAEFLMFLKNFRMPLRDYISSAIWGWKPKNRTLRSWDIDLMTAGIQFDALRETIQTYREDPDFRREFDIAFYELDDDQWERLLTSHGGIEHDVVKFVQSPETRPQSRSIFSQTDNYQQAARYIARYHEGTHAVIMGHTHYGMDAQTLNAEGTHEKFLYLNTGTWTKTYDIPWWKLPKLEKLLATDLYQQKTGIVRCAGSGENLSIKYFEDWHDALIA